MQKIRRSGIWFSGFIFCGILFGNYALAEENPGVLRHALSLNGTWKTMAAPKDIVVNKSFNLEEGITNKWYLPDYDDGKWRDVKVPHNRERENGVRWYRERFSLPESFKGKRILLRFDVINYVSWVWINGKPVYNNEYKIDKKYEGASYQGIYTPCEFDITRYLNFDSENLVAVKVFWPEGLQFQWGQGRGMKNVKLLALPDICLTRVLITPDIDNSVVKINALVKNTLSAPFEGSIHYRIARFNDKGGMQEGKAAEVSIPSDSEKEIEFQIKYNKEILCWDPDNPQLYDLKLSMVKKSSLILADDITERFGFRKFETRGNRFYLNNKSIFLRGIGTGWQIDPNDAKELNMNFFRHQLWPISEKDADKADESGFMVVNELPVICESWKHDEKGSAKSGLPQKYIDDYMKEIEEVYLRELPVLFHLSHNHPAIVAWSLGNETWDWHVRDGVTLVNRRYETAKKADPVYPIITASGGIKCTNSGGAGGQEYKHFKTDINSVHWYAGYYGDVPEMIFSLEDTINFFKEQFNNRPLVLMECLGMYVTDNRHNIWTRWLGYRYRDAIDRGDLKSARMLTSQKCAEGIKTVVEMYRSRKGDTAAACFYTTLATPYGIRTHLDMIKKVYSPVFTCVKFYDRNRFTGDEVKFPLYAINDKQEGIKDTRVKLQVLNNDNNLLLEKTYDFGTLERDGIKELPAGFTIGDWPQGYYKLNLVLTSGPDKIVENDYKFFITPKELLNKSIDTSKNVLVIEKDNKTGKILEGLKVKFSSASSLDKVDLNKFNVLIAASCIEMPLSAGVRDWVKNGGRALFLEQSPEKVFRTLAATPLTCSCAGVYNSFIDTGEGHKKSHPVFKGLLPEQFEEWNGYYWVLAEGGFFPYEEVKEYSLASVYTPGWGNEGKRGSVVLNFMYGKGEYLVNQVQAMKRYGADPIATRYVQNLFEYILKEPPVASQYIVKEKENVGVGPFSPDKEGFIQHFLICGPFPNPGGRPYYPREVALTNQLGFDKDFFLTGEKHMEPAEGMKHEAIFSETKEGYWGLEKNEQLKLELTWEKAVSSNNLFDLSSRSRIPANVVCYAACYVESPEDRQAKVKTGSDDGYKLWINHELTGQFCTFRGVTADSETYPVKLKKGMNPVMLKIIQDTGGFGFCLRFTDLNDKPLTDLKVWLAPNK